MLFNESPDAGGYPRKAFFHVTAAADKQALLDIISGLGINRDKTNNASTGRKLLRGLSMVHGLDGSPGKQDRDEA